MATNFIRENTPRGLGNCMKTYDRGQAAGNNFHKGKNGRQVQTPRSRELHRKTCASAQVAGNDFIREKMGNTVCGSQELEDCMKTMWQCPSSRQRPHKEKCMTGAKQRATTS